MEQLEKLALEAMEKNGFQVVHLKDAKAVKDYLLENITPESSVGCGGSVSVQESGILDALEARGNKVFSHWRAEDKAAAMRSARSLKDKAQTVALSPVPRALSSSCGTCVRYTAEDICKDSMDVDLESIALSLGDEKYGGRNYETWTCNSNFGSVRF